MIDYIYLVLFSCMMVLFQYSAVCPQACISMIPKRYQDKGQNGQRLEQVKIHTVQQISIKQKINVSILLRVLTNRIVHVVHWPKPLDLSSILTFVHSNLCPSTAVLGGSGKKILPEIASEIGKFDLKFERFLKHTFYHSKKTSVSTE